MISIDDLTLGEVAEIEKTAGQPLAALADEKALKGKLLQAMAYVAMKRENPKAKFEDAASLTMKDVNAMLAGDESKDFE